MLWECCSPTSVVIIASIVDVCNKNNKRKKWFFSQRKLHVAAEAHIFFYKVWWWKQKVQYVTLLCCMSHGNIRIWWTRESGKRGVEEKKIGNREIERDRMRAREGSKETEMKRVERKRKREKLQGWEDKNEICAEGMTRIEKEDEKGGFYASTPLKRMFL